MILYGAAISMHLICMMTLNALTFAWVLISAYSRVYTCEEESNSRTFQGHSRPCIRKLINSEYSEEKGLEISKI